MLFLKLPLKAGTQTEFKIDLTKHHASMNHKSGVKQPDTLHLINRTPGNISILHQGYQRLILTWLFFSNFWVSTYSIINTRTLSELILKIPKLH